MGRKKIIIPDEAFDEVEAGASITATAKKYGVSRGALGGHCKEIGIKK